MGGKSICKRKTSYYILFLLGICATYISFSFWPDKPRVISTAVVQRSDRTLFCDYKFLVRATLSQQMDKVIMGILLLVLQTQKVFV